LLFQDDALPQSSYFLLQAVDSKPDEVVVEMPRRQVRLKFTDQPRPPEPPAMQEVLRSNGTGVKGLQKIGQKFLEGG